MLVLILDTVESQSDVCSSNTSSVICVLTNNISSSDECQGLNASHTIHQLSNLSALDVTCHVRIYFTSGTHYLTTHLSFEGRGELITLQGYLSYPPSVIQCNAEDVGIQFIERSWSFLSSRVVTISNLVIQNCGRPEIQQFAISSFTAALHFTNMHSYALENVTIANSSDHGLHATDCQHNDIENVKFQFSSNHALIKWTIAYRNYQAFVNIYNTQFMDSSHQALQIYSEFPIDIHITGCNFTTSEKALQLNSSELVLNINSSQFSNTGLGVVISHEPATNIDEPVTIAISNSVFSRGSQALNILVYSLQSIGLNDGHIINISFCLFLENSIVNNTSLVTIGTKNRPGWDAYAVASIKNSVFENNGGSSLCSNLNMTSYNKVYIQNVNIADTYCTGVSLFRTSLYVLNYLNLSNNSGARGGGIEMRADSEIVLNKNSRVLITNNTALLYGGGIFTDQTCENGRHRSKCYFQFDKELVKHLLFFSGNKAALDGDDSFGGCLSNCYLSDNNSLGVNIHDPENIFWSYVSTDNQSPSGFAEPADGVTFCSQTNLKSSNSSCNTSGEVSVFRGEPFSVSLKVVDHFCFPSFELPKTIQSTVVDYADSVHLNNTSLSIENSCQDYHFIVTADLALNKTTVEFSLQEGVTAILGIQLIDCPLGFTAKGSSVSCTCSDEWRHYSIKCNSMTFELSVPAEMWVGVPRKTNEYFLVQHSCKFCKNDGVQVMKVSSNTSILCLPYREGTLCGNCIDGYSFQLGRYECADCSKSTGTGIFLLLLFAAFGAILIVLLLCLNLTVATGRINGLIFYSHIIYLNLDSFLRVTSTSQLQNFVRSLSTFQAWINLDFGITTCFFHGYNAYTSTWMGFVFPVYIWLLILLIVIISKYSSRVSKLTGSNTVPVLATLLLLSYTKVIRTSVDVFYSVKLRSLSGNGSFIVWALDGDVLFASLSYLVLFLASVTLIVLYIIPFTLLILLGPLLLAKSHFRPLRWVQRIMPFLDAFYGPHEVRYWPGLLLLARLALFYTFATDSPPELKYLVVSMVIVILLIIWAIIGQLYRSKYLNYLEMFFFANLLVFTIFSQYFQSTMPCQEEGGDRLNNDSVHRQQVLAVIMVGSALVVFLGIITVQILLVIAKCKPVRVILSRYQAGRGQAADSETMVVTNSDDANLHGKSASAATHSEIDLQQCLPSGKKGQQVLIESHELRERLLTNN